MWPEELWWDGEDAEYIRSRSTRYPQATDIEPEWTLQAAADWARVVRNPDPKSRVAYIRLIGYSPGAGFVLTVIIDPQDFSGVTAWKTRGADLRHYLERKGTADG
jgi:dienelactone hydrolase